MLDDDFGSLKTGEPDGWRVGELLGLVFGEEGMGMGKGGLPREETFFG